jgi:cvfA/B/C family virulence factor
MAKYQILYWHGIPVQVRVRDKKGRVSKKLPQRFMDAVDSAAMASNNVDGESYTNGFQWGERQEREGDIQDIADALITELEEQYPEIDYRAVAQRLKAKD